MSDRKLVAYIAGPMRGVPFYNFPAFDAVAKRFRAYGVDVRSPADMDREVGFDAMKCPPDTDWDKIPTGFSFDDCVKRDLEGVRECDVLYLLQGWEKSVGARAEKAVAEWLGKPVRYQAVDGDWYSHPIGEDEGVKVPPARDDQKRPDEVDAVARESQWLVLPEWMSRLLSKNSERQGVLEEAQKLICGDRNAAYGPPTQDFQRTADMMTALFGHRLKDGERFESKDVAWVMLLVKASRAQHSSKRDNYVDAAGYAACGWECEAEKARKD